MQFAVSSISTRKECEWAARAHSPFSTFNSITIMRISATPFDYRSAITPKVILAASNAGLDRIGLLGYCECEIQYTKKSIAKTEFFMYKSGLTVEPNYLVRCRLFPRFNIRIQAVVADRPTYSCSLDVWNKETKSWAGKRVLGSTPEEVWALVIRILIESKTIKRVRKHSNTRLYGRPTGSLT